MLNQFKHQLAEQWQDYTAKFKTWWSRLSLQEQRIVAIGGTVATLLLFYMLIWSPTMSHLDKMRKRIKSGEHTLAWMMAANNKIKVLESQQKRNGQQVSPVALLSILQKQINENALGLSLKELKQASNETIELEFKQAEFDQVIKFMTSILKSYRVSIQQFSATAAAKPGIADIEIVLKL